MYTRSYYPETEVVKSPPESYNGIAFSEQNEISVANNYATYSEIAEESPIMQKESSTFEQSQSSNEKSEDASPVFSFSLGNLPFIGNWLKDSPFKNFNFGLSKIGTEEILIIATAAFLLFSKEGDKECAIILLLLLFVN